MDDSYVMNEDIDQELAPLGSSDSELETDDSNQQEALETEDEHKDEKFAAKHDFQSPIKETEEMPSVRQLRILLFALCSGIQKAAKDMDTEPQLIRTWLEDKEKRLDCEGLGSSNEEAVEHLVEWVLVQREQQHPIREDNLFQKASEIHSQTNQSGSFRISYEWAVTFMLQHKLGLHNIGMPGHQLPRRMEENCKDFTGFVHTQIKTHNVPLSAVGAMDELSIFVDFDRLVDGTESSKASAFRLEGTGKPWMNIYLSMLANGTMLPTMLFMKGTPLNSFSKGLSELVQLEARVQGFSEKEELEIWTSNVWQRYLNSQNGNKAMLVIDGHHSHMTEDFLSTLSGTQTLPMVIPSGCSSEQQPLEMCVRPVLKKLLLCRWSYLTSKNKTAEVKPEDLVRLILSWLEEALVCFSGRPQMIQHSFCFSRLVVEHDGCKNEADAQMKLLTSLTEAMLWPEVIDSESQSKYMEKHVEGILAKKDNGINDNKSSVVQAEKEILEKTKDDSGKETERIKTEQQAQAMVNKGLEVSSETSERCSLPLPDSAVPHVTEERCQNINTTQMDTGSTEI